MKLFVLMNSVGLMLLFSLVKHKQLSYNMFMVENLKLTGKKKKNKIKSTFYSLLGGNRCLHFGADPFSLSSPSLSLYFLCPSLSPSFSLFPKGKMINDTCFFKPDFFYTYAHILAYTQIIFCENVFKSLNILPYYYF